MNNSAHDSTSGHAPAVQAVAGPSGSDLLAAAAMARTSVHAIQRILCTVVDR